jgi:hypothetical protein
MAHGYLREYDEDPGDDRERGEWRDRDDRDWRGRERGGDFMFGEEDRARSRNQDDGRGFFSRAGDEARSWFSDDERGGGPDRGAWENNRDWPQRDRGRQGFSNHPDDHYRSWRDRQMRALDNDYADYCREREQQFHRDFDNWRSQRHGTHQPLRTGMTQSGLSDDPTGELQLETENRSPAEPQQDPMAAATLGTTSSSRKK